MQYLLQHRANPQLRDKRGFTAIHYAVAGGNQAALEALLNAPSPSGNVAASSPGSGSTIGQEPPPLPALTPIHLAVQIHTKLELTTFDFNKIRSRVCLTCKMYVIRRITVTTKSYNCFYLCSPIRTSRKTVGKRH